MKFWKTVVRVTVLSGGDQPPEFGSLADVDYAITEGDCSGQWGYESTELAPREMAQALAEQGSDPEFLGLDDEGKEVEL